MPWKRVIVGLPQAVWRLAAVILVTLLTEQALELQVWAQQQQRGWLQPENISNTPVLSGAPLVAADQSGRVHVIWGEHRGLDAGLSFDTAYYTRLAQGVWSQPVDFLAVPPGESLVLDALVVDPYQRLALVWHQDRGLRVSIADAVEAGSLRGWTSISLDRQALVGSAGLAVDASGAYHLVYVSNYQDLVYVSSRDAGRSWSEPTRVALVDQSSLALLGPTIAVDEAGTIYVSWTRTSEQTSWGAVGVWFARSTDQGQHWDQASELASGSGYGWSDLLVDKDQNVHVLWLGSGEIGGRYHCWSRDGGQSWSRTLSIAEPGEITGLPGKGYLLLDSAGVIHGIFAGYGQGLERVWHSVWNGETWSEPEPISGNLPDSQWPSAAIEQGHRIHVTWHELEGGDVWYTSSDTGSAPVTLESLAMPTVAAKPSALPAARASPTSLLTPEQPSATASVEAVGLPTTQGRASLSPLLAGILPAVVVVLVIAAIRIIGRR